MNRTKLAELVTIWAGMATVISGVWSFCCAGPHGSTLTEGTGLHAVLSDAMAGKVELTDEQIDALATMKIKSIESLRPLVHQLCADVRQLKVLKISPHYDVANIRRIEQRVLEDKSLIMQHNLEDHQTVNRILGS